ncbi:hypothetical protein [Spiroplasma endosymbiont of Nebria brevicollis]|uniref:hypothetical protein n=1 Tax=Spiroplasma endosymbiont of Nebria brevicollis TaxID=3066284 RepID=UPI00313CB595
MKKELEKFKLDNINWFFHEDLLNTSRTKSLYVYHEDTEMNDLFWFNSKLVVNLDEKMKKYAIIYTKLLLKEDKFRFTHAEQLKELEDCFTYFKNELKKSINFNLKWKNSEVENFNKNMYAINTDNDDI